ncbi:hypothetical protein MGH68_17025 [Erysipelothrix sp. D19-032]
MQELSLMDVKERFAWQKWFDALDRLEVYERFEDVEILNTSLQRVDVRLIPSGVMFEIILPHLRKIAHYSNENESELKMTMDHFESYVRFREESRIGWRDRGESKTQEPVECETRMVCYSDDCTVYWVGDGILVDISNVGYFQYLRYASRYAEPRARNYTTNQ